MRFIGLILLLGFFGVLAGCTGNANSTFTAVGGKVTEEAARTDAVSLAESADEVLSIEKATTKLAKKVTLGKVIDGDMATDAKDGSGKVDVGFEHKKLEKVHKELDKVIASEKVVIAETTVKLPDTKEKPATPAPPAVADAVVGRETSIAKPKEREIQSGILTAGSFDDNINPQVFQSFIKKLSQMRGLGDLPDKLNGQRLMVIVKDGAGKPVGNVRVKVSAGAGAPTELVTRSDGRAIFLLSLDQLPTDQNLLATVTGPDGGAPTSDTITAGANRWEITLPGTQARLPKNLDLAIVLDTTGSMSDELNHLKAEIRGISAAIKQKFPEVQQRFAFVVYRDEGDEYVTRRFDFTDSLDLFHKNLSAQSAGGGGDYPEAMHKGLDETLQLRWLDKDTARITFLIGDAPPHAQHMNSTLTAVNNLRKKGVALYPVACSGYDDACEFVMRSSALLTGSQFLFLTDDSGVVVGHGEPRIPYYEVERLEKQMIRMISSELSGQHIQASPADILRTVGKKVN